MIIAVASGKGGTGKTTVAVNLALTRAGRVQFLDCDVEEPNAHLLLHPEILAHTPVELPVPRFEAAACTKCGRCVEVCAYNALALIGGDLLVFENLCHGCGGCVYFCPEEALREGRREIGEIERGRAGALDFAHGRLQTGEALAPPVIAALRRGAAPDADTVVVDCPPGTSCPVIRAVRSVDYCLVVTEPTPFGQHDLEAMCAVLDVLRIPYGAVVNRADLGDPRGVEEFCRRQNIPLLGHLPFDRQAARAFTTGEPLVHARPDWRETFTRLWTRIEGVVHRA